MAPSAVAAVARGVEALRKGKPVLVRAGRRATLVLAVETARDSALSKLKGARLVLTHERARTLKIRLYTPEVVALPVVRGMKADALRAIADPAADMTNPLKGPFEPLRETLPETYAAGVRLAKLAGLLPAIVVTNAKAAPKNVVSIDTRAIASYEEASARSLQIVTRAHVPLAGAERTELVAFRDADAGPEHYAIIIGEPRHGAPLLTRLHSECFTGDLLGSLKCDCGAQLRGAIETISKSGSGILLYLAQEGRGIGLVNKLRAYRLQDQGFDTMQANERLGFEPDERIYAVAARMLKLLGYSVVRLLTNNPDKVAALEALGIHVSERVPHSFPDNPYNRHYLETKAKAGQLL